MFDSNLSYWGIAAVGFLAQGYGTTEAAILGVSFHAIAGDRAASVLGEHSMIASDIVDNIRIE